MTPWQQQLHRWARLACRMDVLSPKPGNVSPGREFSGATVADFLQSADAIAPVLATAPGNPLGRTILLSAKATRNVVAHNTNLGIILLLAPLAAVPEEISLHDGISGILNTTTVQDAENTYAAIRLMNPGGLGTAPEQDVHEAPSITLLECMQLAAARDQIALQYHQSFRGILDHGLAWLAAAAEQTSDQPQQIVLLALQMLRHWGDSLIARKCDAATSDRVREMAAAVLRAGWPHTSQSVTLLQTLDTFLRDEQHTRNPGTTADLVAATLFAAQREQIFVPGAEWNAAFP